MEACVNLNRKIRREGPEGSETARRVGKLILGFLLAALFIFGLNPLLGDLPAVRQMAAFIEERGIDASALYYTDVEEASVAAINLENTMDYMPSILPESFE